MKPLTSFVYAVLAGAAIAIGGVAFLSCESKVAGAFFFLCRAVYRVHVRAEPVYRKGMLSL